MNTLIHTYVPYISMDRWPLTYIYSMYVGGLGTVSL